MEHFVLPKFRSLLVAFIVVVFALACWAQTGSIAGTVTDSTGAVVQGAQVTVKNTATNVSRAATSGTTGAYSVPNLSIGIYEITITKASFKTFRVQSIQLTVAQTLTVNAKLDAGAVSEEVQVRGDQVPNIDLETSQVSNLVDSKQMKELPLILRDPYQLVLLSPGVAQTNAFGGVSVNGARERNNNFLLDGVDNNDTSVPGGLFGVLGANPDSTEEFRVITNNFAAEFGRNTGAIIDVVTKSGTNNFHGGAYWFGRYNGFGGARDYFNPASGGKMNPYTRNLFGFSVGGPIWKNKTFFFVNTEFQRFVTTLTNYSTVPTRDFKAGVFTYVDPAGVSQDLDLTESGGNNAYGLPLDTTTQRILALYPDPTISNGDGISGTLFFPSASRNNAYSPVVKLDHHFTDRESLGIRYQYNHSTDPNGSHDDFLPGGIGATASKGISQGLSAQLTSTFSNSLINTFQFGWNHIFAGFNCTNRSAIDGVDPAAIDQFGNARDYLMSPFTDFGCLSLVSNGQYRKTGTTSYTDNITWVHGGHTFKFGGDFRNIGETGPNSFYSRRYVSLAGFNSTGISLLTDVNNPSTDLESAAWALYGLVFSDTAGEFFDKNGTRVASDNKLYRQHEYDWFAQDTWKVRPNLTLTFGLRYQLDGVPYEENANLSNLLTSPESFPVVFSVVGPGTGKSIYQADHSNLEPRVGFSWDPRGDGKTAIRGGFGIFHDRVFGNLFGNARGNPPFEQDWSTYPLETLNNAFGSDAFPVVAPTTTPSLTVADQSALAPVIFDTHFRNPSSNNWNFGIQRELPGNNVIDIAYVGSKGSHIFRQVDGNPPDPTLVNELVAFCASGATFTNIYGDPTTCSPTNVSSIYLYLGYEYGVLPGNAVAHNALVQPSYNRSVGNSIYHSLQTKFTHRFSHGTQIQAAYTWAHGIDDSSDPFKPAQGNRTYPRNSRNLAQDRGNSDNDIRHIGVINYIWELPFGRGKSHLSNGFVGRVFEGWQISGITTLQTGIPFEVRSTRDSQRTGISAWATQVDDPFVATSSSGCVSSSGKVYFKNQCAFEQPAWGGPGGVGRNQFRGPGYVDFDLVWSKKTQLTEKVNAELRVECYNLFNRAQFQQPDNLITDSTFGAIFSTQTRNDGTTSARQMQVGLKLNF